MYGRDPVSRWISQEAFEGDRWSGEGCHAGSMNPGLEDLSYFAKNLPPGVRSKKYPFPGGKRPAFRRGL